MAKALRNYVSADVPQCRPASPLQAKNNAGGFSFVVTDEIRLERFLILGTDGGSYYVNEVDLTTQNVDFLRRMIQNDPERVLSTTVDISYSGRAYRNTPAIFVLALLLSEGSDKIKQEVRKAVPQVARTATMAYDLADFISKLGGWGPAKVKAIRAWFESKTPAQLAFQAVKYRQRNGWTLRDLMRLSHPKGIDPTVGGFILNQDGLMADSIIHDEEILNGFKAMQTAQSEASVVKILREYPNLPWETIPTQFLKSPLVWKTLFENGLNGQALVRNVTRFAKIGLLNDQVFAREFANRLTDEEMIRKTRLHPMNFLNAYVVYKEGQISGGGSSWNLSRDKSWQTSAIILDALDDAFGLSFGNIDPANKRTMISVDTSASMGWWQAGNTQLSAFQGAGAMALITARTEPYYEVNAFSTDLKPLSISARDSLDSMVRKLTSAYGGGTNCSLPMLKARSLGKDIDTFIVITDNETWAGSVHPHVALEQYRQATGNDARLVVMAMVPTQFSIANPLDRGMLDVVGFDANAPKVVADFSAGRI